MENFDLFSIGEAFSVEKVKSLSSVSLAFVGDAVYSLYVREKLVSESSAKTGELNKLSSQIVCAKAQAKRVDLLMSVLTEEELAVYKRARNHKTLSQAKNANIVDYKRATGLEAVIGYLYLSGKIDRLNEILKLSVGENNEN